MEASLKVELNFSLHARSRFRGLFKLFLRPGIPFTPPAAVFDFLYFKAKTHAAAPRLSEYKKSGKKPPF